MQSVSSRIWTRVAVSNSCDDNHYTIGTTGTKLLFPFLSLRFFDMRRERNTQFLSMLTFPSDPHHVRPPPQTTGLASASSENRLPSSSIESQLQLTQPTRTKSSGLAQVWFSTNCFFSNPPNPQRSRAWRHSRPQSHFLSVFFYCDNSDCHIHPARVWTPALN